MLWGITASTAKRDLNSHKFNMTFTRAYQYYIYVSYTYTYTGTQYQYACEHNCNLYCVHVCDTDSGWSAKLEVGERYIQVWAPDNGHVPFPSIITIRGVGTLWAINWRWGTAFPCVPLHFNHWIHRYARVKIASCVDLFITQL